MDDYEEDIFCISRDMQESISNYFAEVIYANLHDHSVIGLDLVEVSHERECYLDLLIMYLNGDKTAEDTDMFLDILRDKYRIEEVLDMERIDLFIGVLYRHGHGSYILYTLKDGP